MELVCVVIPVYKDNLSHSENLSLVQCCKILQHYPVTIISPSCLKISEYETILQKYSVAYSVKYLDNYYFCNIQSYNRLLLSDLFYQCFIDYRFILIYQLDAYVFKDELMYWCNKGYDYVGAPLIGKYTDNFFSEKFRVGNGGFSLRKVQTFLDYFSGTKKVFTLKQNAIRIHFKKKPYTRLFVLFFMFLGWRNKPNSVAANWNYNEDDFWSGLLDNSNYALNKPSPDEAFYFAFERFPSGCYQRIGQLPFGCHAWEKYEYESFWKAYIK